MELRAAIEAKTKAVEEAKKETAEAEGKSAELNEPLAASSSTVINVA